jgi:hypothetical protein
MLGPHGEPLGYDRDGRVQGVGQLHSTEEAFEQGSPLGTGGEGGGKGAGQGERGGVNQEPDTVPGSPVTCAQPRTAGTFGCLHVRPEAGARCGSAARRDLCGGCRVTGIPTATMVAGVALGVPAGVAAGLVVSVLAGAAQGLVTSVALGMVAGIAEAVVGGVALGVVRGVGEGVGGGLVSGMAFGGVIGMAVSVIFGVTKGGCLVD